MLPDYLAFVVRQISAFSGITFENMTRGPGWRFMDLGRRLERTHQTAGLMHACQPELQNEPPELMEALLKIMDSSITYRSRYLNTLRLEPLCDLLLLDDSNPRSLLFQLSEVKNHVERLDPSKKSGMPPEQRLAAKLHAHVMLLDLKSLCQHDQEAAFADRFTELESGLESLHNVLSQRFFNHSHSVQLTTRT